MKKILIVIGTRPEAIKMAPLVKEFENYKHIFNVKVCVTAQHRELLDHILDFFEIKPDYDLNIMKYNQDLFDISVNILTKFKIVLENFKPDIVLVHGDTTTTFVASLASFYKKIKIGHVEAGLRTYNLFKPWPEEANRQLTDILADYYFAPTKVAKENLIKEGKKAQSIVVTGNTVIDALLWVINKIENSENLKKRILNQLKRLGVPFDENQDFLLVTTHRRENLGQNLVNIYYALKEIALNFPKINIIYPLHPNPKVQKVAKKVLHNIKNVYLIPPLDYPTFVYVMSKALLILSDSGGIQEEAPYLGKFVLVLRDTTERVEALKTGIVKLVGTKKEDIFQEVKNFLLNKVKYQQKTKFFDLYGDGKASKRIVKFLMEVL